jgi:DNA repair protein RecO (recombination protein O)
MGRSIVNQAVVIRHVDYRESDRVVTLFTRDFGQIAGLARGVRRSVKRFSGHLDLFTLVEIRYQERRGLFQLESAGLISTNMGLRNDLLRIAWAAYFCELTEKLLGAGEPHPTAFHILVQALAYLSDSRQIREGTLRSLELKLLLEAGFLPELQNCVACRRPLEQVNRFTFVVSRGGPVCEDCASNESGVAISRHTLRLLSEAVTLPPAELPDLDFSRVETLRVREIVNTFIRYYAGISLKSSNFLMELMKTEAVWPKEIQDPNVGQESDG